MAVQMAAYLVLLLAALTGAQRVVSSVVLLVVLRVHPMAVWKVQSLADKKVCRMAAHLDGKMAAVRDETMVAW